MMAIFLMFILIMNVVAIVLTYHCLADLTKKEKFIFIAVGIAIMYILTSIVYWISTWNIEMTEVAETGKNLITFLFVPVNGLIVLPLLAKSYVKFKFGGLNRKIFTNRGIVLTVLLLIVLGIECVYFKNIQTQVINLINENKQEQQEEQINLNNSIYYNLIKNEENQDEINTVNVLEENDLENNALVEENTIMNTIEE